MSSELAQAIVAVEPLGTALIAASELAPYVLVICAFTFLYKFVPNTQVDWLPALAGGFIGGVMWQSAGWAFAAFVVSSTRYAAIYASFAILVLFLFWLYVSWLVMLVGVAVAFYVQHPEYLYARPGEPRLSNRMRERLAMAIMRLMGDRFLGGNTPWTLHGLTHRLNCPMHSVSTVLDALAGGGLIVRTDSNLPAYTPAKDLWRVSLADILAVVRCAGEDKSLNPDSMPPDSEVERIAASIEKAIEQATRDITVASMTSSAETGERSKRRGPERHGS